MIADLGNKMQVCTQRYGKRPYGVGLLVAGYDDQGPHIFQTCPSSNYYGEFLFLVQNLIILKVWYRTGTFHAQIISSFPGIILLEMLVLYRTGTCQVFSSDQILFSFFSSYLSAG